MELSIVIVNWNVRELLRNCLSSLAELSSGDAPPNEVIVVDSGSSDGSREMVRGSFPSVQLVASPSNLGFVRGNNLGVALSHGRFVLLLNPDTEVKAGSLRAMVQYMGTHPDVGVVGPRLLHANGQVQPSRRRFPTLATAFVESTMFQPWFSRSRILRQYYVQDVDDDEEQDVDWLVGACLLIRREAWDQVGPLDEHIFMYSEEPDWCRRAAAAGWRAVYLPSAMVVHHEAQSSSQVFGQRHIYFQSSKVYYFRKHHGLLTGEVLRLFLLGTYVCQMLLEAAKWLLGSRRELRKERVNAYAAVLRSGLRSPGAGPVPNSFLPQREGDGS